MTSAHMTAKLWPPRVYCLSKLVLAGILHCDGLQDASQPTRGTLQHLWFPLTEAGEWQPQTHHQCPTYELRQPA